MNTGFIKAIVVLPGTALAYVPALIVWLTRNTSYAASFPPQSGFVWLASLIFAVPGLVLMIWTMRLFAEKGGGGTPAPWEPIQNFVVEGPYQHMRNPMLTGVILFQIAQAILLQSTPLFGWAVIFFIINTFYFMFSEEPQLEKRFGDSYIDYKRNVPRWIPRRTPYAGVH
ncbi:MAG: methyltransferase family protein [Rhizobiaceae bacterium]